MSVPYQATNSAILFIRSPTSHDKIGKPFWLVYFKKCLDRYHNCTSNINNFDKHSKCRYYFQKKLKF